MNRSGNIGAAKNMDSVFADFTDEEIEQDLIFDEDDQLVEIVEGYTEEGNTVFEEDQEIFNIVHQIEDENKDKPEEIIKDTEKILGPDNMSDQKISDIENVKKEEIDDSQTIDKLEKNGDSEAEKELDLDKLEDEYHKTATVAERAYQNWLNGVTEEYDYDKENEAEGTDDKFGPKIDNTAPKDGEEIKPDGDPEYNDTADASVDEAFDKWLNEDAYEYDKENEAEGTDDKFGPKIDNTKMDAGEEIKPDGDVEYNKTNDASVDESFEKWLHEEFGDEEEAKCDCGKDDCPICGAKKIPTTTPDERHEESNNDNITAADGEGIAPGKVDDNSLPTGEGTPEGSPECDNGDITDDECKKLDEAFDAWLNEADDLETPVLEPNKTILPEDIEKAEEELEKNAPETGDGIDESFEKWLNETDEYEGTEDNMPEDSASVPEDEGCCGKGKGSDITAAVPEDECGASGCGTSAMVGNNALKEETMSDLADKVEDASEDPEVTEDISGGDAEDASVDEAFDKWLHEEEETIEITQTDVNDAASTEVDDTEADFDALLADEAEDDSAPEGGEVEVEYDPTDEDLIDEEEDDEDINESFDKWLKY